MTDPVQTDAPPASTWNPDDLVYVDPDTNSVVGKVAFGNNDNPKSLPYVAKEAPDAKGEKRRSWRKFYPWGTFRSMKNVFKVEGKPRKKEPTKTLNEVIEVALKEPYWD
ncbi:MAG: hypothetical protein HOO67_05635 [Candidatus Peribacteraceae bacterium]|nr:hypothetical protein [Candidatus Peribacteraceae bacterium]